jgi:hypothetical protein
VAVVSGGATTITAPSIALAVIIAATLVPVAAFVQQALLLAAAALLRTVSMLIEVHILSHAPLDPVYAGAALRIAGGIETDGLAVAGGPGSLLHWAAPSVFGSPELVAPGAVVSALILPGATVMARALATLLATAVSLVLITEVSRGASAIATTLGLKVLRAWLLLGLARETALDLRELDATGLPFALAMLAPVEANGQRALLTRHLDGVPTPTVEAATGLTAILVCAVATRVLSAAARPGLSILRRSRATDCPLAHGGPGRARWLWPPRSAVRAAATGSARLTGLLLLACVAVLAPPEVSAIGRPSAAATTGEALVDVVSSTVPDSRFPSSDESALVGDKAGDGVDEPSFHARLLHPPDSRPTATPWPTTSAQAPEQPFIDRPNSGAQAPSTGYVPERPGSVVTLRGRDYDYTLTVDGQETVIRGMGYNPWYSKLPPDDRRERYDRDFRAIVSVGVNTLEGWFQDEFDEVTLDAAHRHGLDVIMPFELNQDYDYGDPAVRASFRDQISAWVLRYRGHPAVLMWGPGNEVLHRLIFPSAVQGSRDALQEKRADEFAAFYVELIDVIHELDPDHPVVYRDAEDLYFARIRHALLRDGKPRPWFVYGTNVYTRRLAEVIRDWPTQGLDAPLLVSEFSPGGVGPAERPQMLGWYWAAIRAHPKRVIGGVVYTWATEGPEDLDRVFGLTDAMGRPVDGSLDALSRLFRPEELDPRGPT